MTTMTLQNNNFEGSDFQFRDHPRLEHVDMSGNMLLQPFPLDFFKATRLVKFICANCGLTGVLALPNKGVSSNPDLEELVLFNNELFGILPDALWSFPSLRVLDLSDNNFYGEVSADIGRLRHLEVLELASNRLFGPIPHAISQLVNLHSVRLEHNEFSGVLPRHFRWHEVVERFCDPRQCSHRHPCRFPFSCTGMAAWPSCPCIFSDWCAESSSDCRALW